MGRGKVSLELIPKARSRKITYEKRKSGLMKKAREFSVLCGVDACVIIGIGGSPEPQIWPPSLDEVRRIIARYRNEIHHTKQSSGLSQFFERRKKKLVADLVKARKANWEARYAVAGFDELLKSLSNDQLKSLMKRLELAKEKLVKKKEAKHESGREFGVHGKQPCDQMIHDQDIGEVMQPPMLSDAHNNFVVTRFSPQMNTMMHEEKDPWTQCKGHEYYPTFSNSEYFNSLSSISSYPMQHTSYCVTDGGFIHPAMEHGSAYFSNNAGTLGTDNSITVNVNHVPLLIQEAGLLRADYGESSAQ